MTLIAGARPTRMSSGRVKEGTVLLVASFGALLAFLDATIVNVAFPSIRESFAGTSIGTISWVLNAYNIILAAFMVVFGRLSDLVGRRRIYAGGIALFTLASVVCALAPSVEVLVAARIAQAFGSAMLVPASLALVIEAFPVERRSHAIGLWGAAAAVAAGLGPPVGGALVEAGGWSWAFWVNVPLGVVAFLLARRLIVESRAPGWRRVPDLLGALLFAGALGFATTAIIKGAEWGWGSALLWGAVAGFALTAAGFVWSSRRHPSPLLDLAMLRARPFVVGNLATILAGMGFYAYLLTNILWLQYVWGYSVLQAGLALAPAAIVAAVVAGALGPFAARHGFRWVIVGGFVVWALAYVWYVQMVGVTPSFLGQWLPGQVLSGIGAGATMPLLGSAALATQPGGRYATASAVVSSARQVGGVIGIAALVVILGTPTRETVVALLDDGWRLSIGCFAVGAVLAALLGTVRGKSETQPATDPAQSRVHLPTPHPARSVGRLIPPAPESLYARLPEAARERIASTAPAKVVPAGEWLVRAGEAADSMFVLVAGRAEVVIDDVVVRELGPGAVVGELALLTGGTRSASVRARRDCEVLEVSRSLMDETISSDQEALSALVGGLARQLADSRPPAEGALQPSLVAVVATAPDAPAAAVAASLRDGLAAHLRVALLDAPTTEQIDRAEPDNDRVVVVATGADPEVTARLARQADVVVLVARAGSPLPERVPTTSQRPELVLVGSPPTREEVATWSALADPWRITVLPSVDDRHPAALAGLVDRLAGRSVGLVLGGGGARGFAHIGVLLELEAAGVRVDRVAGASVGSIIAGLAATGAAAEQIEQVSYREFVRERPFSDYTLPRQSLARGRRAVRAFERNFGDVLIEQLPLGFRCVSTDLLTRTSVVHRTGRLVDAVSASVRLPVLFPPLVAGQRLLVDGGVLDNLPVDVLTERDEGPVVAVNISMSGGRPRPAGAADAPRPPRQVRVPAMGETLLRTLMIGGGDTSAARETGAYVLTPDPMGVGLLEFHQYDRMVASGRSAARALLEETGGDLNAGWRA